jgi:predicted phosphoribosyltransferase
MPSFPSPVDPEDTRNKDERHDNARDRAKCAEQSSDTTSDLSQDSHIGYTERTCDRNWLKILPLLQPRSTAEPVTSISNTEPLHFINLLLPLGDNEKGHGCLPGVISSMRSIKSVTIGPLSGISRNEDTAAMFDHRDDAANKLVTRLQEQGITPDAVVAVTHGGLAVGDTVCQRTGAPLSIIPVNTIDAPFNDRLPIGAVTYRGTAWLDDDLIEELEIGPTYIDDGVTVEQERALDRAKQYDSSTVSFDGKTTVIATDGVTSGERVRAVARHLYRDGASTVVLATPVIPQETLDQLTPAFDKIMYLETPEPFLGVHHQYKEFPDIDVEEAQTYLAGDR